MCEIAVVWFITALAGLCWILGAGSMVGAAGLYYRRRMLRLLRQNAELRRDRDDVLTVRSRHGLLHPHRR